MLCLLLAGIPASAQTTATQNTLITSVNIVSTDSGEVLRNRAVLIGEGRIIAILPEGNVPGSAPTIVDGQDGYLIPDLADMHAHVPSHSRSERYTRDVMTLFLANGVTTIRGMLGERWHLELRSQLEQQQWQGPHLVNELQQAGGGPWYSRTQLDEMLATVAMRGL